MGMCSKCFTCNLGHFPFAAPQQTDFVGGQHPGSGRGAEPSLEQGGRRSERTVSGTAFQGPVRVFDGVHAVAYNSDNRSNFNIAAMNEGSQLSLALPPPPASGETPLIPGPHGQRMGVLPEAVFIPASLFGRTVIQGSVCQYPGICLANRAGATYERICTGVRKAVEQGIVRCTNSASETGSVWGPLSCWNQFFRNCNEISRLHNSALSICKINIRSIIR